LSRKAVSSITSVSVRIFCGTMSKMVSECQLLVPSLSFHVLVVSRSARAMAAAGCASTWPPSPPGCSWPWQTARPATPRAVSLCRPLCPLPSRPPMNRKGAPPAPPGKGQRPGEAGVCGSELTHTTYTPTSVGGLWQEMVSAFGGGVWRSRRVCLGALHHRAPPGRRLEGDSRDVRYAERFESPSK
jgi:hypothetical protein